MADVSDPSIVEAYEETRKDGNEVDWMIVSYPEGKNDFKLFVQEKGSGSISQIPEKLRDDQMAYVYTRVEVGDAESRRTKFVFISWCGESVSAIRRAKMSVHKADVKRIMRDFSVEVHATTAGDLDEADLLAKVTKSMGADYSTNS